MNYFRKVIVASLVIIFFTVNATCQEKTSGVTVSENQNIKLDKKKKKKRKKIKLSNYRFKSLESYNSGR